MEKEVKHITVAVLPFENLSDSDELHHFSTGFTEDLITDLSRFDSLQIISHHSTRDLDDSNQDLIQTLMANYLVKGSFRYHQGNLRITTQLINLDNKSVIWADRFNEPLEGIFQIQDDIIEKVVNILQQQIEINLLKNSQKKNVNLQAYDFWLRGMEHLKKGTVDDDLEARKYFEKALEVDPNYSRALSGLSLSYFNEWSCQLWERWDVSQKGAHEYAEKAVKINENDYIALMVLGRTNLYLGNFEKSEHYLRKSLRINPNDADNLIQLSSCFTYLGYQKEAEKLYLKAVRLNPLKQDWYNGIGSFIYFELEEYEKCLELGLMVTLENTWVDLSAFMAGACYYLNRIEECHLHWDNYLKMFGKKISGGEDISSKEAAEWTRKVNPYRYEAKMEPFLEYILGEKPQKKQPEPMVSEMPDTCFIKDNGIWKMAFSGSSAILKDMKGLQDIQTLLMNPGKEIHCMELMGAQETDRGVEILDEQAKKEIQERIQSLTTDLEEAELQQNYELTAKLRTEYDELVDHVSASIGIKGKSRNTGSSVEKCRSAVTWRIRNCIKKIEPVHSQLSIHLANSIKTGTYCVYQPETLPEWEF